MNWGKGGRGIATEASHYNVNNVNDCKHSYLVCGDSEILFEYERQFFNNFQSSQCDSLYPYHVASSGLSDCVHYSVNNPILGIFGNNRGNVNTSYT